MPDDGFRHELVRGELRRMPYRGFLEGQVSASITTSLGIHVKANRLGTAFAGGTGFLLESDPDHVRAPCVAYVRRERAESVVDRDDYFPGAPDLAIEVVSPSDLYADVEEKVADLLDAGALAVVVVNPHNRTVKVHRSRTDIVALDESDTLDVGDVVPGWRMSVKDILE